MVAGRAWFAGMIVLLLLAPSAVAQAQPGGSIPVPDAMRRTGVIRFAADFTQPPGTFLDANHHMTGVDYELCTAISRRLGLKVQWTNLQFSGLIPALNAGRFDAICSSMFITPERAKAVAFVPYRQTGQGAAVVKGNPHNVHDLTDLCGLRAAELLGSVYDRKSRQLSQECIARGKPAIDVKTFSTVADAFEQLIDGRADVVMADDPIAAYYVQKAGGAIQIAFSGKSPTLDGIAVAPQNYLLAGALTSALYALKQDGTYAQLLTKWHIASGGVEFF